jgi:hypothetical protein
MTYDEVAHAVGSKHQSSWIMHQSSCIKAVASKQLHQSSCIKAVASKQLHQSSCIKAVASCIKAEQLASKQFRAVELEHVLELEQECQHCYLTIRPRWHRQLLPNEVQTNNANTIGSMVSKF